MKIKRILNPVAQENTYILENESASLVIDPGSNTSSILAELEEIAKPVVAILLTHTHYDHIISVEAVRQAYNHPPVYVAETEKDVYKRQVWITRKVCLTNTRNNVSNTTLLG